MTRQSRSLSSARTRSSAAVQPSMAPWRSHSRRSARPGGRTADAEIARMRSDAPARSVPGGRSRKSTGASPSWRGKVVTILIGGAGSHQKAAVGAKQQSCRAKRRQVGTRHRAISARSETFRLQCRASSSRSGRPARQPRRLASSGWKIIRRHSGASAPGRLRGRRMRVAFNDGRVSESWPSRLASSTSLPGLSRR